MEQYNTLMKRINQFVLSISGIMILAMMVIITWQVVARYFLKISTPWCEEVARYLFIYVVMLGSAACVCNGGHVSVSLLTDRLPAKSSYIISVISSLISLVFYVILTYAGYLAILSASKRVSTVLEINMSYVFAAIPISGALMFLYGIGELHYRIKKKPETGKEGELS